MILIIIHGFCKLYSVYIRQNTLNPLNYSHITVNKKLIIYYYMLHLREAIFLLAAMPPAITECLHFS